MRVAYICADPGIPVFGNKGASVHVQEVLKGMIKRGLNVVLFAQRLGGEPPKELKHIKIYTLPTLPNITKEERALAALAANHQLIQLLENAGPFELIYERYSLWSNAGMYFARKHQCIGLLEVNAPLIEEQKKHRELPLEEQAQAVATAVFANADAIIAVSPGVQHYLETFKQAQGRIHVIANGVDLTRFASTAAQNEQKFYNMMQSINTQKTIPTFVVGFLGTLKPWHGVSILIQAWALLRNRGYHIHLLLIGDGPQYNELYAEIKQLGLLDHVQFTGSVPPETVPQWLTKMDIAVAPYPNMDGFYFSPLKIYEYMAAGLPIIATRVGHLASIIDDNYNGILIESNNPELMADNIITLLSSPLKSRQLGLAARRTAEQKHSWLAVVDRILDIANTCKTKYHFDKNSEVQLKLHHHER